MGTPAKPSAPPASSATSITEWDIKSGAHACTSCEKAFAAEESLFTRLTIVDEGYQREDHCAECWKPKLRKESLSFWKSVYKPPPPKKEEPLKKENVEDTLRALIEEKLPENTNTIFVLTLMLERKRLLAEKDVQVQEDGRKLRMYEHKATGDTFVITDPDLKLAEIEAVQEEVATMLGWREKPIAEPERKKVQGVRVAGLQVETSTAKEDSDEPLIPALWAAFAEKQLADTIESRIPNSPIYGIYSGYAVDESGSYTCMAGVAIEEGATPPEELALMDIAEGEYLAFPLEASEPEDVQKAWTGIHGYFSTHENLTRAFAADFEAYEPDGSLFIYVSVLPDKKSSGGKTAGKKSAK